jgi:hypothetical protein
MVQDFDSRMASVYSDLLDPNRDPRQNPLENSKGKILLFYQFDVSSLQVEARLAHQIGGELHGCYVHKLVVCQEYH